MLLLQDRLKLLQAERDRLKGEEERLKRELNEAKEEIAKAKEENTKLHRIAQNVVTKKMKELRAELESSKSRITELETQVRLADQTLAVSVC